MKVKRLENTQYALDQLVLGAEAHGLNSAPRRQLLEMLERAASQIAEAREGEDTLAASLAPSRSEVERLRPRGVSVAAARDSMVSK
jgi:hypothetical protein